VTGPSKYKDYPVLFNPPGDPSVEEEFFVHTPEGAVPVSDYDWPGEEPAPDQGNGVPSNIEEDLTRARVKAIVPSSEDEKPNVQTMVPETVSETINEGISILQENLDDTTPEGRLARQMNPVNVDNVWQWVANSIPIGARALLNASGNIVRLAIKSAEEKKAAPLEEVILQLLPEEDIETVKQGAVMVLNALDTMGRGIVPGAKSYEYSKWDVNTKLREWNRNQSVKNLSDTIISAEHRGVEAAGFVALLTLGKEAYTTIRNSLPFVVVGHKVESAEQAITKAIRDDVSIQQVVQNQGNGNGGRTVEEVVSVVEETQPSVIYRTIYPNTNLPVAVPEDHEPIPIDYDAQRAAAEAAERARKAGIVIGGGSELVRRATYPSLFSEISPPDKASGGGGSGRPMAGPDVPGYCKLEVSRKLGDPSYQIPEECMPLYEFEIKKESSSSTPERKKRGKVANGRMDPSRVSRTVRRQSGTT
jgi:hypothetical protein